MKTFDEKIRQRAREEPFSLPEDYAGRVYAICASLEDKDIRIKKSRWWIAVAAAVALFVAVPNLSAPAAQAMEKIPVLGAVVRVITLRNYVHEDDHSHANVDVPQVEGGGSAATSVNAAVQVYVNRLVAQFQADCRDSGEAYEGLDVSYQVVTDTQKWFTLRVDAVKTQASGYQFSKIYNINKTTDQVVALGDLFRKDTDWQTALTDEVRRQMEGQQADTTSDAVYFPELFKGVTSERNYYFSASGELVLAFDEYEIAPGSQGAPEFTIPKSVYESYLIK